MMEDQKSVNVRLPLSMAQRLRREAFDREVSQGSVVADALARRWADEKCTCRHAAGHDSIECDAWREYDADEPVTR